MKNMTAKEKFLFIFLQIITLGLIWIYWKKHSKKYNKNDELSQEIRISVDINQLLECLGGKNNISEVENTHTKVKIFYKNRELIKVENIKNINGISGVFVNDKFVVIIVGNSATTLKEYIKEKL
ncbi:MAG: PTS transporter subunit EIIB [Mycoplasma sp.]|nr:PTS transporter subunit EIIB [Mycoplasma sp.]